MSACCSNFPDCKCHENIFGIPPEKFGKAEEQLKAWDDEIKGGGAVIVMDESGPFPDMELLKSLQSERGIRIICGVDGMETVKKMIGTIGHVDHGKTVLTVQTIKDAVNQLKNAPEKRNFSPEEWKLQTEMINNPPIFEITNPYKEYPIEYHGDLPRQKSRSGGNNRKGHKRKKAKNGRNKRRK